MKHDQLASAYKVFFRSEAGKYLLAEIDRLIDDAHKNAESDPLLARDYTQRAKGTRDVLDHIKSVGTEIKKGRNMTPQPA